MDTSHERVSEDGQDITAEDQPQEALIEELESRALFSDVGAGITPPSDTGSAAAAPAAVHVSASGNSIRSIFGGDRGGTNRLNDN